MSAQDTPASAIEFMCCDFAVCQASTEFIGPAAQEAIAWLTGKDATTGSIAWLDSTETGSKDFVQSPSCIPTNVPLCVSMCCLPCCGAAVNARSMSKFTGRTCEAEALICCALNCFCLYPCYKAKVHNDLRTKYGLKGSKMTDCAASCCWGQCMVCQEAVEMGTHGLSVPYVMVGNGSASEPAAKTAEAAPAKAAETTAPVPAEAPKVVAVSAADVKPTTA